MMTGAPTFRSPVLLVHGGAWDIPPDQLEAHTRGVLRAVKAGYALLRQGASALDAVEAAVTLLEDDETFDAGRGSFLTADGRVQLDALLMDGATLRAGRRGLRRAVEEPDSGRAPGARTEPARLLRRRRRGRVRPAAWHGPDR